MDFILGRWVEVESLIWKYRKKLKLDLDRPSRFFSWQKGVGGVVLASRGSHLFAILIVNSCKFDLTKLAVFGCDELS